MPIHRRASYTRALPSWCDGPVEPRELKVKRVGDFVDDGLNGSLESIDGGWVQANRNQIKVGTGTSTSIS